MILTTTAVAATLLLASYAGLAGLVAQRFTSAQRKAPARLPAQEVSFAARDGQARIAAAWQGRGLAAALLHELLSSRAKTRYLAGDLEGALHWTRQEHALVRDEAPHVVDTVEGNLAFFLGGLQRQAEALAISGPRLERIGDSDSANLPYAWYAHLRALLDLGHLAEARRVMPRALASGRRHNRPLLTDLCALLVALEGRPRAALPLLGHAAAEYEAAGQQIEQDPASDWVRIRSIALREMTEAELDALVAQGRALDAAAADRLFLEAAPG